MRPSIDWRPPYRPRREALGDAISRLTRPLPRADRTSRANPRGFLRLAALDLWIGYGADLDLRQGFWQRRVLKVADLARNEYGVQTLDDVHPEDLPFSLEPITLETRRYYTEIAEHGETDPLLVPSWNSPATSAKWIARSEWVRSGVLERARERLLRDAGVRYVFDRHALADLVENLGVGSVGARAIDATLRAGVFDDLEADEQTLFAFARSDR